MESIVQGRHMDSLADLIVFQGFFQFFFCKKNDLKILRRIQLLAGYTAAAGDQEALGVIAETGGIWRCFT